MPSFMILRSSFDCLKGPKRSLWGLIKGSTVPPQMSSFPGSHFLIQEPFAGKKFSSGPFKIPATSTQKLSVLYLASFSSPLVWCRQPEEAMQCPETLPEVFLAKSLRSLGKIYILLLVIIWLNSSLIYTRSLLSSSSNNISLTFH